MQKGLLHRKTFAMDSEVLLGLPANEGTAMTLLRLAAACDRPDDQVAFAAAYLELKAAAAEPLSDSQRALVSAAFKQRLSSYRSTMAMLEAVAAREEAPACLSAVDAYARQMETGILNLTTSILELAIERHVPILDDALGTAQVSLAAAEATAQSAFGQASDSSAGTGDGTRAGADGGAGAAETPTSVDAVSMARAHVASLRASLVWWMKLAGDYCRYVSESHREAGVVARHSDLALSYYAKARSYALTLAAGPASPALLGVCLNLSVFLFEIRRCQGEAFELAAETLTAAVAALMAQEEAERRDRAARREAKARAASGVAGAAAGATSGPEALSSSPAASTAGPRLTTAEKAESGAICALIAENLRLWHAGDPSLGELPAAVSSAVAAGP